MKRYGNLFDRLCTIDNINLADDNARKGKVKRYSIKKHDDNKLFDNDAYNSMSNNKLNTGFTYSNSNIRCSIIVISNTSTPAQFMNSYDHERYHLITHILEKFNINPYSEEAAYLTGYIG